AAPEAGGAWIKNARKSGTVKVIDVYAFAVEWWAWWASINPKWCRRTDAGRLERTGEGAWDVLDLGGPNGFLNVLICLWWWRDVLGSDEQVKEWTVAVADVQWVCEK
ncbi:hypothetical protein C8J57DRAFT_964787, partial [Mycena rebaudengoi]